jgi:hypothetical protein
LIENILFNKKYLGAQYFTAFVAATVQYRPPRLAGHALHKTVLVCAVAFLGLMRSFWHYFLRYMRLKLRSIISKKDALG